METTEPLTTHPDLKQFHDNNPTLRVRETNDGIEIRNLWGSNDLYLSIRTLDSSLTETLNALRIDERFDAIMHVDNGEMEFVFTFLDPNDEIAKDYVDRVFEFSFEGITYHCNFGHPTQRLYDLAKVFRRNPGTAQEIVPMLDAFRDWQLREQQPERVQRFFQGKEPRSFFIRGISSSTKLPTLFRHINSATHYYDRRSPAIVVREETQGTIEPRVRPVRYLSTGFPARISIRPIDDVILTLLEGGARSGARTAFLHYYQVLEYAGYSYTDAKVKSRLRKILRDPAIVSCDDDKISALFDTLLEHHVADAEKILKVIEEYVDMKTIWIEVENDMEFFSNRTEFDGGFIAEALVSRDVNVASWESLAVSKLFRALTSIRNVIVHAREKRENKVILPTEANAKRLRRFLPVIRRVAEDVALRY
jgi:hypothetical protein